MRPDRTRDVARRIVLAMLEGELDETALRERMMRAFRPITPWLVELAVREVRRFRGASPDRDMLVERVLEDASFQHAVTQQALPKLRYLEVSPAPPAPLRFAEVPAIESSVALASWLGVKQRELRSFADTWRDAAPAESPLRHYRYAWRSREYGPDRLIEIPKRRLRAMQRRVLAEILNRIAAHDAAHGFVRGRSPVTHARLHAGRDWVLRVDLEQFFPSIAAARVRGVFRWIGYADGVSRDLAALCTSRVPAAILARAPHAPMPWFDRQRYREAHLPQGAPTSPALANLVARQLDARLAAFASRCGLVYSRYADDLTFSGETRDRAARARILRLVATIAEDSGFRVNHRKTCVFGRATAQRVTGIVVNRHANISRSEFDCMKAILTNALRHGPHSQNRDDRPDFRTWLQGKLAWYRSINPARTAKLDVLFARIVWD